METLTLTELGARLAHRWRTLAAGALVGLMAAAATQAALPTRFEATTVVRVDATEPAQVDMSAERAVATSRRVTAEALDALGDTTVTIDELEGSTGASAVDDSRLLRITFAAGEAEAATRGADALAHAYLAARAVHAAHGVGGAGVAASVLDPARTPTSPVGPGAPSTALGGTVLGLLLAAPVASRSRAARAS